ncbi:UNVERIFIED_CONTAM: hypothetical protein NCL1_18208 [Trichonephila clavipes]
MEELCPPPECFPYKLGWNRTKSYCHLYGAQSYGNHRRHLALCHDEFRGPRSGFCRSGGIINYINYLYREDSVYPSTLRKAGMEILLEMVDPSVDNLPKRVSCPFGNSFKNAMLY